MSRSQSQSTEDKDLADAEPHFNYQNDAWILPSSESEYRDGRAALQRYLTRLIDDNDQNAQFYARADNLRDWLVLVEKRLGSLSQRLSASVGIVLFDATAGGAEKLLAEAEIALEQARAKGQGAWHLCVGDGRKPFTP
jgi:hypothetical protein